jgi:hypothetical protein
VRLVGGSRRFRNPNICESAIKRHRLAGKEGAWTAETQTFMLLSTADSAQSVRRFSPPDFEHCHRTDTLKK